MILKTTKQKKYGKLIISIIAAVMLIVLAFLLYRKIAETTYWRIYNKESLFSVVVGNEDHKETIKPSLLDNIIYFFLPACAGSEKSVLAIDTPMFITFDGKWIHNSTKLSFFEKDKEYDVKLNGQYVGKVVFMYGENLPSMFIDTKSGDIDYISADKENKESGSLCLVDEVGNIEYDGNLEWISGRGNQTWSYEKKPWTIKLKDKSSLLAMNNSNKWVLIANVLDDTAGLRNYIAYNMAEELGLEYSRDQQFINLYLNGEYYGLYLLTEKIQVSDTELDIGNLDKKNEKINEEIYKSDNFQWIERYEGDGSFRRWAKIASPDNITGGYILERSYGDKLKDKDSYFVTSGGEGFVIRDPSVVSEDESQYIFEIMSSIERALNAKDFIDPKSGNKLTEMIDVDSWVLKYLVDEVTNNEGAGTTSSYFYKKKNDPLIYAGPVWDYDKSFGSYNAWISPDVLSLCELHSAASDWWAKLYQNEDVREKISDNYKNLVCPYLQKLLETELDEYVDMLDSSYKMNYYRWRIMLEEFARADGLQFQTQGLQTSVDYLKDWIKQRVDFLNSIWLDGTVY